jgi:hypothetical protein
VRFEFLEQRVAFGVIGAFEGDALVVVWGGSWRGVKFGATEAAQAGQNFPCELVDHPTLTSREINRPSGTSLLIHHVPGIPLRFMPG